MVTILMPRTFKTVDQKQYHILGYFQSLERCTYGQLYLIHIQCPGLAIENIDDN